MPKNDPKNVRKTLPHLKALKMISISKLSSGCNWFVGWNMNWKMIFHIREDQIFDAAKQQGFPPFHFNFYLVFFSTSGQTIEFNRIFNASIIFLFVEVLSSMFNYRCRTSFFGGDRFLLNKNISNLKLRYFAVRTASIIFFWKIPNFGCAKPHQALPLHLHSWQLGVFFPGTKNTHAFQAL